jgi:addiction module HigA family antidote
MNDNIIETPAIGEILKEEFLDPLHISAYKLAKDIHVSTSTILDILHNKRKISVEMALRLAKYFGTSSKFWLNLQNEIDLRNVQQKLKNELDSIPSHSKIA